ncbi:MAG TPA: VOC family protein [Bryobacteraceae bacterium]|jgi:catechol 2,3-dioxygenase-like lactoylglutathione lyase family enzyme
MLGSSKLAGFVGVRDPERAKAFYRDTLGLKLVREELPFALVFDCQGTMLRVSIVREVVAAPYTVLGWEVTDITAMAGKLAAAGVKFQHYTGLPQDELGIWTAPGGARIAWFQDLDGNLLSISQH